MTEPACYRVPLSQYPGLNRFVLDWLAGEAEAFLPRLANNANAGRASARPPALVDALIESNRRWGNDVADDLRQWATGGTMTIIAGQQVNFAGGPLYTIAKLLTLVKMRRDLEEQGRKATLFFWLATEDHDFNEVSALAVPVIGKQRDLAYLRASRSEESRQVVGPLPIPASLIDQFLQLFPMERPPWLREGITFRDSFAELIAEVLRHSRVVLIDALLPELRREGGPLFERIVSRWNEVQSAIATRSEQLARAGYDPQVAPRQGGEYTLLYEIDAGGHRNLLRESGALPKPESISTSALTRPLLQDFVFQPDVFVGGPAEVSYYAQIEMLHPILDVPRPRVALRGHVLLAPKRVLKLIRRYDFDPAEVFTAPDELLTRRHEADAERIEEIARRAHHDLLGHIEQIADIALPADHALARSINRSIGHIEYHFRKLAERAIRGLVRKDRERHQAARELFATFYPDEHVQDRIVAWFPFWHQFGEQLLTCTVDALEPDSASFSIVGL